ncbi:MAG: lysine 5,6-aminomutase subunit alpha [Candidatus Cloacimonetes bacterium]|jgi:beta-lysine 5,6-aminomutase alpha subunit|nr:lysine 5,6-aminomutase subunit alpha [Candidatus Cloacimonadota bacterium]MDY0298883.1 lysine 5,6-aminomutase subunit alpha [Candidatus Cloacimonadaceae bacterium]MCB5277942.1 lysine 5,6-aminomutase subunit alpha [Candidatus Cloacimonadota bacterium]MCK9332142.1 lysine 5,6-aminomutase subunit alpha [Candidatus Cloacimonadota bacterium]MDD2210385.1 lysine 5,6-aminomutase subunit alpha [Candidatus Cloacimonadota bacterium]
MLKLELDIDLLSRARLAAKHITGDFSRLFASHSSVTIERTVLRFMGIDGATEDGKPLPNVLVDSLQSFGALSKGAAVWVANAMHHKSLGAQEVAEAVALGELDLTALPMASAKEIYPILDKLSDAMLQHIATQRARRDTLFAKYGERNKPAIYVIVATGNIYEDVTQAKAAAREGADIIAVIRSTAQSLLDYVPYGATTVGFGGTYATQENFRIMRKALDEVSEELGRYICLTNYASGLCMPEIAAMGAIERLDLMLNDAMYGILFRDINPKRTLLDQYFARMINAYAGIEIQTGEDNYLTTSDAVEKAYTVTASQLLNESFALMSGIKPEKMGLGHAHEIDPELENSFMYELAHAMLARELFPDAPVKYMPPTKFASGNIFKTHLMDAMFNFIGQLTGQGVQLLGMMTEAIHTPHLVDRSLAIENAQYLFKAVKDLGANIQLSPESFVNKRANLVLRQATEFLEKVAEEGLYQAMTTGEFAEIKRPENGGKGLSGVFERDPEYFNPFMDKMKKELGL